MRHLKTALALCAVAPLSLAAAPAAAQTMATAPTYLDIAATGTVDAVPDLAIINTGVETRGATADAALSEASARVEAILAALDRAGVAERDIQTSRINLYPQFDYQNDREPRLTGYRAGNSVTVRFRDIEQAGEIVDALVKAGANQINGPSLTFADAKPLQDRARLNALTVGRQRAEAYANALGMRVVRLAHVSEGGGNMPPPPEAMAMADQIVVTGSRSVPIRPGEQEIAMTLSMRFELR